MARFDVHANPNPETRERFPYLLDVQDGMLEVLATRIVVPLMPLTSLSRPMDRLNPVFEIEGRQFAASVSELVVNVAADGNALNSYLLAGLVVFLAMPGQSWR